jgi:hypothetical protein
MCHECFRAYNAERKAHPGMHAKRQERTAETMLAKRNRIEDGSDRFSRQNTEALANDAFASGVSGILEVRTWQDGTDSDLGVRPRGIEADEWLAVQCKATAKTTPKYQFALVDQPKYDTMVILGFPGTLRGAFVPTRQSAWRNGYVRVGDEAHLLSWNALSDYLVAEWNVRREKGGLFSEQFLRMQCSPHAQLELCLMQLHSVLRGNGKINWPRCNNSVVDRLVNGMKVQDKAATWDSNVKVAVYKGTCSKSVNSTRVPYEKGDVDVFVFSTVHVGLRLFMCWEIPEKSMEEWGILATRGPSGEFVWPGKRSIPLGMDENTQKRVFGRQYQKRSASIDTSQYLFVHELPPEYKVPDCLKNRDPEWHR